MAIKDSLIGDILKIGNNTSTSEKLYKRLRPTIEKNPEEPNTNRTQTEHKPNTNRTQTGHKPNTISPSLLGIQPQTEHKPDTKLNTQPNTNRTQTGHKPNTSQSFSSLVGLQRKVLLFLFHDCKTTRSNTTQEMSLLYIADNLNIRLGSVKTTLARLVQKKFIFLIGFKNGRGGWHKYEIPDMVYKELIHIEDRHKPDTNRTQTEHKPDTKLNTQPNTNSFSSSSVYINTSTTKGVGNESFLDSEWDWIDFSSLVEIGFGEAQLKQLAKSGKLTPEQVQDSIHAFAFALTRPEITKSIRTNHLTYFMGILNKKGDPYLPPAGYESPRDQQLKAEIERKRRQLELENELKTLKFEEWYKSLSKDKKDELIEQELTDELRIDYFSGPSAGYIPEHVKEKKRKEVLKPLFFNNFVE